MFPYPNPKTPQEALRQCRTHERVQAMHEGTDYFWYRCDYNLFGVARRSFATTPDTAYTLTLYPLACNCPDFTERGGYCKHTAYLWEQLERAAAEGLTDAPEDIVACLEHEAEDFGRVVCFCDRADRLVREAGINPY